MVDRRRVPHKVVFAGAAQRRSLDLRQQVQQAQGQRGEPVPLRRRGPGIRSAACAQLHLDRQLHDRPAQATVVRWEVATSKGGTLVRVTHSGLAELPVARKDYAGGWPGVLANLKDFVEEADEQKSGG